LDRIEEHLKAMPHCPENLDEEIEGKGPCLEWFSDKLR